MLRKFKQPDAKTLCRSRADMNLDSTATETNTPSYVLKLTESGLRAEFNTRSFNAVPGIAAGFGEIFYNAIDAVTNDAFNQRGTKVRAEIDSRPGNDGNDGNDGNEDTGTATSATSGEIRVFNDGNGVPHVRDPSDDKLLVRRLAEQLNFGANFDSSDGHGRNGQGASLVMYTSKKFVIWSFDTARKQGSVHTFDEGDTDIPGVEFTLETMPADIRELYAQGFTTGVRYTPSPSVYGDADTDWLLQQAYLRAATTNMVIGKGVTVTVNGLEMPNSVRQFALLYATKEEAWAPVEFELTAVSMKRSAAIPEQRMKMRVVLMPPRPDLIDANQSSFAISGVNTFATPRNGTHLQAVRKFVRNLLLGAAGVDETKADVPANLPHMSTLLKELTVITFVKCANPSYDRQTKDRFVTPIDNLEYQGKVAVSWSSSAQGCLDFPALGTLLLADSPASAES